MEIDLYSKEDKREQLSHLKQLILLALADGRLDKRELGALAAVASRDGLTRPDVERCIKDPDSVDFVMPDEENSKAKYLRDMVLLMMADGVVEAREMEICRLTAQALGYEPEVIDGLLYGLVRSIEEAEKGEK